MKTDVEYNGVVLNDAQFKEVVRVFMAEPWYCEECRSTTAFGKLHISNGDPYCPECGSSNINRIQGTMH